MIATHKYSPLKMGVIYSLARPDPSRCAMISGRTEGEGKEKEGSGDSGEVSVGYAGILAEPIRLK